MAGQRKRRGGRATGTRKTTVAGKKTDIDDIDRTLLRLKKQSEYFVNNVKIPTRWLLTMDEFNERKRLFATSRSKSVQAKPTEEELEQYMQEKMTVITPVANSKCKPNGEGPEKKKGAPQRAAIVEPDVVVLDTTDEPDVVGDTTDEESYEVVSQTTTRKRTAIAIKDKPSFTKGKPSSTKGKPSSTKGKPSSTKDKPSSTKDKPSSTKDKPSSTKDKPSSTKDKLSSTSEKPSVVKDKPSVIKGKPSVIEEKTSVTKKATPKKDSNSILKSSSVGRTTRSKSPMVTTTNPFQCDYCEKSYKDASSLKKHTANIHKNLVASRKRI